MQGFSCIFFYAIITPYEKKKNIERGDAVKRWMMRRTPVGTLKMCEDMKIAPATACALSHRGIVDAEKAKKFLHPNIQDLYDSLSMKDMEKGLLLVTDAIKNHRKIAVYGDYDVDGVMSSTILTRTIRQCGGDVMYYVPHRREEGYGLNLQAVKLLADEGVKLLFTCDNGIAAAREVAFAKEQGMQILILDHHEPPFAEGREGTFRDILPDADVIINPKQKKCDYPFPMLCAAGISYKFAILLFRSFGITEEYLEKELLSFAAVATVCDIVDLLEENRILVQAGLREIQHTTNVGLRVLLEETGLGEKPVTEYHLGFIIGPCINATGRLESAGLAVALFCETEEAKARQMAKHLVRLNEERKEMTTEAANRIEKTLEEKDIPMRSVLVLYEKDIDESIAGIVAGRIKDKYYHPVVLLTDAKEGVKGSARSIPAYHIFEALFGCKELFTRFGGHAMAAGLSLPYENIPLLEKQLNDACSLTKEDMTPVLRLEKQLSFQEIHLALAKELRILAPFGKGNPSPLFASKKIWVRRLDLIGKNRDMLRMTLMEEETGKLLTGISFDGYDTLQEILKRLYPKEDCDKIIHSGQLPMPLDIVYRVEINSYGGRESVQLMIQDFREAN